MSQSVSNRHTRPVLRNLIGTGLVCGALVGAVAAVLTLPWLVLRLVLWVSQ
jgi:uncharacterized membrane protein YccC